MDEFKKHFPNIEDNFVTDFNEYLKLIPIVVSLIIMILHLFIKLFIKQIIFIKIVNLEKQVSLT